MDIEKSALILRALGDKTRMQILSLLRNGEKCGNELLPAVEVGQSTLSHHMKALVESGLIVARKAGKWTYYSLAADADKMAAAALEQAMGITLSAPIPAVTEAPKPAEKKKPVNKFETWL